MSQDEGLKAFEAALAALVPRADRLDRDRVMFLAGQAHGQDARATTRRWAWPMAFSAMTALAAALLVIVLVRPEPQVIVRTIPAPLGGAPAVGTEGDPGRSDREGPRPESPPSRRPQRSGPGTPGPAFATAAETTALATAPLWRIRSPEVAERLSNTSLAQVLDEILPQALGSDGTQSSRSTANGESSYHDLRDAWLKKPGRRGFSPRPSVLDMFPPLGARS